MKNLLEWIKNRLSIHDFIIGVVVIVVLSFVGIALNTFRRPSVGNQVIIETAPKVKLNLSSDRDFLGCIYEQLKCYNGNAGLTREVILKECKEINYCDEKK